MFNNDVLFQYDTRGNDVPGIVSCPGCFPDVANNLTWQPHANFGSVRGPEDYQAPRSYQFTLGLSF